MLVLHHLTLSKAGVGGMDISEIFENAFDNQKSFEPKEIAESIEFLTVEGYIYKLGIGTLHLRILIF